MSPGSCHRLMTRTWDKSHEIVHRIGQDLLPQLIKWSETNRALASPQAQRLDACLDGQQRSDSSVAGTALQAHFVRSWNEPVVRG